MNGTLYVMGEAFRTDRIRMLFGFPHYLICVLGIYTLATVLHIVDIAKVQQIHNICRIYAIANIAIVHPAMSLCVSIHSNTFACRFAMVENTDNLN